MDICEIYSLLAYQWISIRTLPIKFGVNMIFHLKQEKEENKAFQMWLMRYINMDKKSFVPFERFYQRRSKLKKKRKSKKEILDKVYKIRQSLKK